MLDSHFHDFSMPAASIPVKDHDAATHADLPQHTFSYAATHSHTCCNTQSHMLQHTVTHATTYIHTCCNIHPHMLQHICSHAKFPTQTGHCDGCHLE